MTVQKIIAAIQADPNIDPALARVLSLQHAKQQFRRFDSEPITGFGGLPFSKVLVREADAFERAIDRKREIMADEYADQVRDERAERIERGE